MPNAVITGASKGIGKAIAEKLLSEGFSIAICSRSKDDLDALKTQWQEQYPNATIIAHPADFTKKEDVLAFADVILDEFAELDMLVNNIGVFKGGDLETEPDGLLEDLLASNLLGPYHLTRQLLPSVHHSRKGHIFNICSVASERPYAHFGSYSITKYALKGFSDNLREELKESNIRVTAISPSSTYTSSWEGSNVPESRLIATVDIAEVLWTSYKLSASTNIEHITMKPRKGDL